jgi:hypothetical protein
MDTNGREEGYSTADERRLTQMIKTQSQLHPDRMHRSRGIVDSLPERVITKWTVRVNSCAFAVLLKSLSASIRVHLRFVFSLC